MNFLEITPKGLDTRSKIILFSLLAMIVGFSVGVLPDFLEIRATNTYSAEVLEDGLIVVGIWVAIVFVFVAVVVSGRWKKIRIEGNLVHFLTRGITSDWQTTFLLDLERVRTIDGKSHTVQRGRHRVEYYWLIFTFQDDQKRDFEVSGWNTNMMKELFTHIQQYYPDIILNTRYMKDSLERISGLDEYIKKQ